MPPKSQSSASGDPNEEEEEEEEYDEEGDEEEEEEDEEGLDEGEDYDEEGDEGADDGEEVDEEAATAEDGEEELDEEEYDEEGEDEDAEQDDEGEEEEEAEEEDAEGQDEGDEEEEDAEGEEAEEEEELGEEDAEEVSASEPPSTAQQEGEEEEEEDEEVPEDVEAGSDSAPAGAVGTGGIDTGAGDRGAGVGSLESEGGSEVASVQPSVPATESEEALVPPDARGISAEDEEEEEFLDEEHGEEDPPVEEHEEEEHDDEEYDEEEPLDEEEQLFRATDTPGFEQHEDEIAEDEPLIAAPQDKSPPQNLDVIRKARRNFEDSTLGQVAMFCAPILGFAIFFGAVSVGLIYVYDVYIKVDAICPVSDWSDWSPCKATCGLGRVGRVRAIDMRKKCKQQKHTKEFKPCENRPCVGTDCEVSDWSLWGMCAEPCGRSTRARSREVMRRPTATGRPCPPLQEVGVCNAGGCASACHMTQWSPWTRCSTTCGLGDRQRVRLIQGEHTGLQCPHLREVGRCEGPPCQADCVFNELEQVPHAPRSEINRCNNTPSGRFCNVQCDPGFWQTRPLLCASGVISMPTCDPRPCDSVPHISHSGAIRQCRGYRRGSSCRVTCDPGYHPVTSEVTCTSSGEFSPGACDEIRCKHLPNILFADMHLLQSCLRVPPRQACPTFSCGRGRSPTGPLVCSLGNFNRPMCQENACVLPPDIPYADEAVLRKCAGTPSRHVCTVHCKDNFRKTGDVVCLRGVYSYAACLPIRERGPDEAPVQRSLQSNLSDIGVAPWEATTLFMDMAAPDPEAVTPSSTDSATPGVVFSSGSLEDAGWEAATARSRLRGMDAPPAQEGTITSGEFLGAARLLLPDPAQIWPPPDRPIWAGDGAAPPACGAVPEVAHAVPGSAALCRDQDSGTLCPLYCQAGFQKIGDHVCFDGQWQLGQCITPGCPTAPQLLHAGDLSSCAGSAHQDVCVLTCQPGFAPTGVLQCQHGTWQGAECTRVTCSSDPPVVPGAIAPKDCAGLHAGDTCALQCRPGFTLRGSLRCQRGGHWKTPECIENACVNIPIVPHTGDLSACRGMAAGSVCSVNCAPGYVKTADVVCLQGDFTPAQCLRQPACTSPPVIAHVAQDLSSCEGGTEEACPAFTCMPGYQPTGPLRCVDGRFTHPRCDPLPCPRPRRAAHFADLSQCGGTPSGGVCELRCEPGFAPTAHLVCDRGNYLPAHCVRLTEGVRLQRQTLTVQVTVEASAEDIVDDWEVVEPQVLYQVALFGKVDPLRLRVRGLLPASSNAANLLLDIGPPVLDPISAFEAPASQGPGQGTLQDAATAVVDRLSGALPDRRLAESDWSMDVPPPADPAGPGQAGPGQAGPGQAGHAAIPAHSGNRTSSAVEHTPVRASSWDSGRTAAPLRRLLRTGVLRARIVHSTVGRVCRRVPIVKHAGDLSRCAGAPSGTTCEVNCEGGREADRDLVCLDGQWTTPLCAPEPCRATPGVAHAEDMGPCTGASHGSICPVRCDAGYWPSGDVECVLGQWTSARCEPLGCYQTPVIEDASDLGHCIGLNHGDKCAIRCRPGYQPTGDGALLCSLGNWNRGASQLPVSCTPRDCFALPEIRHSQGDLRGCAGTKHGRSCGFECVPGYEPTDALACWMGQFAGAQCRPRSCTQDSLSVAKVHGDLRTQLEHCLPTESGHTCAVHCPDGRFRQVFCSRGEFVLRRLPCATTGRSCNHAPVVAHAADVSDCVATPDGQTCHPKCSEGYDLEGDVLCVDGEWFGGLCAAKPCGAPEVAHSSKAMAVCKGLPEGSVCTLDCSVGYSPNGEVLPAPDMHQVITVSASMTRLALRCVAGAWVGASCQPAACPSPPAIRHADTSTVSQCIGLQSGQRCTKIACDQGHELAEAPLCSNGAFQGGVCREASCNEAPTVENGSKEQPQCAGRQSGAACPLRCQMGYQPSGDHICWRGIWHAATCNAGCGPVLAGVTGALDVSHCTGVQWGGMCPLVCDMGYRRTGDLKCSDKGFWEASPCVAFGIGKASAVVGTVRLRRISSQDPTFYQYLASAVQDAAAFVLGERRLLVSAIVGHAGLRPPHSLPVVQVFLPCGSGDCHDAVGKMADVISNGQTGVFEQNMLQALCTRLCFKNACDVPRCLAENQVDLQVVDVKPTEVQRLEVLPASR